MTKEEKEMLIGVPLWKGVAISLFWSFFVLIISFLLFDFSMGLMSKANTLSFVGGLLIMTVCACISLVVFDYHIFKVKTMFKIHNNKEESPNPDEPIEEYSKERLIALSILNEHFKHEGNLGCLTDRQVKLVLDAMIEHKKPIK